MKKGAPIILILILFCSLTYGQTPNIDLDIQGKKVSYYVNLEKRLGSKKYKTDVTFYSGNNIAQPEIFVRKEQGLPDLMVYYNFLKKDSTMSEIVYEWDVSNFDKKENSKQTLDFEKKLIAKYNDIVNLVSAKYGSGVVKGDLTDLSLIDSSTGLTRQDNWTVNDSLEIQAYTTISNYYKKTNFVTVGPTHRIRLYVKSVKKEEPLKLNENQINAYDITVNSFVKKLFENNFEEAKKMLAEQLATTVTDDVLKKVKESIKLEKPLKLYMTGMQFIQGDQYSMLQYKYADDPNPVPKELIMIVFDHNNKILAFRPVTHQ